MLMEGVLHERRRIAAAIETLKVGFIVREQEFRRRPLPERLGMESMAAERGMPRHQRGFATSGDLRLWPIAFTGPAPGPRVSKPERRKNMKRRRLSAAVRHRDADQDVVGGRLGVFHAHVEVAVPIT